ncbi:amino acid ABC transporter permease [Bradyrhizobium brasilense]|uniref:amino acid ABC transporter permease n=1 Tax=Bradyrhizobium brasilense TaxID=1419277 RepID=UPI0024C08EFF|nr:amino acid ABC transporter permease [Bradyrhizobium brasilense]MCC8973558.1 amino acid ABC transporter permease [Bradyrhizobium brasilense]
MDFDFSPIIANWRFLGGGLLVTILLSISTIVCATILGAAVGLGRTYSNGWLRVPLTFYVDSMRAMPILVILVWIFFAFPIAFGLTLPPFLAALLALTLHISAYVSEIVRAGVVSVRFGQVRAGLALGMSSAQIIRKIVLPQAIVRILPPYGSILSITIKETAVATVIAVPEYMHQSEVVASQSLRPIEVFTMAMVVYFILLFPVTRGVDFVYRRIAHLGRS